MPLDLSRRHPLVVGTVAAVLALAAAVGAAAAWQAVVGDDERPRPETEIRFGAEDDETPENPLVGEDVSGDAAPEGRWVTFDGDQASLADYRGRPVVVNFFSRTCPPCVEEMPAFEEVHQEVGDQVAFLGLALFDGVEEAKAIVEQTGITYDVGRDTTGRLYAAFKGVVMPSTYLISSEGEIVAAHSGTLSADKLRGLIDRHLL